MRPSRIYLISAALLFTGLILFLIGFALLGFDIRNFDTEPPYTATTYTASGATKEIVIDEIGADIKLVASKDEKVHIKYYQNGIRMYNVTDVSGIVTVGSHEQSSFIGISVSTPVVTIALPANFGGAVKIADESGNITATDVALYSLSAETDNGNIKLSGVTTQGHLELDTENGAIELYSVVSGSTAKLSAEDGNLFIQKTSVTDLYAETESGYLTLADITASGSIFGDSEDGDTQISNVSVGTALTLISENGDIRGTIAGNENDYSYNCDAQNGSCNLPNGLLLGNKQLNIRTENGSIEIYTQNVISGQSAEPIS